jgi:hypothetical protein
MKKRGWTVPMLAEFSPANRNLMGINENGGARICIRLRRSENDKVLYHYEHVLSTMIHELTHIARSPHDAVFYKQMDELTAEVKELERKGITSAGPQMGEGRKLSNAEPVSRGQMRQKWAEREKKLGLVSERVRVFEPLSDVRRAAKRTAATWRRRH